MMALSFIVANYFFAKEMKKLGYADEIASTVTLISLIAGVAGSKLFHLLENPSEFMANPIGAIFNGGGLTFYGGLIVAIIGNAVYAKMKKIPFLLLADATAPSLILAYGIGRIGCQLAGDGDYGIPSTLPWAMGYPNGTVPTLSSVNIPLANTYKSMFPGVPVPTDILVHPTPVYETLACFAIFGLLWKIRRYDRGLGYIFSMYLIFQGIERFSVEFLRLNELYSGLSQAQWISLGLIAFGIYLFTKQKKSYPAFK